MAGEVDSGYGGWDSGRVHDRGNGVAYAQRRVRREILPAGARAHRRGQHGRHAGAGAAFRVGRAARRAPLARRVAAPRAARTTGILRHDSLGAPAESLQPRPVLGRRGAALPAQHLPGAGLWAAGHGVDALSHGATNAAAAAITLLSFTLHSLATPVLDEDVGQDQTNERDGGANEHRRPEADGGLQRHKGCGANCRAELATRGREAVESGTYLRRECLGGQDERC